MTTNGFRAIQSSSKLSPECRRAISVLGEALRNWELYYIPDITKDIINHDSKWFLTSKVSKDRLPDTPEWGWNQSNGKATVTLDNLYTLELFKYNPIRKSPTAKQPSYKLWLGNIKVINTSETFSFLWCEKGETSIREEAPELRLKDLSFLSAFTDPDTSRELGW